MSTWIPVTEPLVVIDSHACTGCGNCLTICGGEVFAFKGKTAVVAHGENCLECGNCEVVCPVGAILFHLPTGGEGIIYQCG